MSLRVGQRSQENRVDDRKNRGICSDSEGKRRDRGHGEGGGLPKHAERMFHVTEQHVSDTRRPGEMFQDYLYVDLPAYCFGAGGSYRLLLRLTGGGWPRWQVQQVTS